MNALVKVCFFDGFTRDEESGLVFVDLNSSSSMLSPVVSLDEVSRPLIHAVDDLDSSKLWILDFNIFRC